MIFANNSKIFDVIIVGGSCSGAAAGYLLSKAGYNVIIIDKAQFPRNKLCGGMITQKTIKLLKDIYGELPLDKIINSEYQSFGIYHNALEKICKFTHPVHSLYFVERDLFDNFFLERATAMGCNIAMGQKVLKINDNSVILESGEEIFGRFIIGADGAFSIVRKYLIKDILKRQYTIGIQANLDYDNLTCFSDGIFPKIFFGYINYGYCWVFPKRDFVTVGMGGLISFNKNNLKNLFLTFLKDIFKGDVNSISNKIKGFPVPLHNFTRFPGQKNKLLVGDAAGLIEPITGEGIYFALFSSKLASQAIINNINCAQKYNALIKYNIHKLLSQAYFMKDIFFNKYIHQYVLLKMVNNAKYCKYYFDLLSGNINYIQYLVAVIKDREKYCSE